jgi:cyclase
MRKTMGFTLALVLSVKALAHNGSPTPEPMALEPLLAKFGWSLATAEITTQKITEDLYVLFGIGGNIGVSVGDDGVLIIDDQFPALIPKINNAISVVGGGDIDFAVNTHWHFDHAEGNLALGPEGTWIVAQENSREMMKNDHIINLVVAAYEQKAYPESAWPDITYADSMEFHFNGQTISLQNYGPAHTTGDTAAIANHQLVQFLVAGECQGGRTYEGMGVGGPDTAFTGGVYGIPASAHIDVYRLQETRRRNNLQSRTQPAVCDI